MNERIKELAVQASKHVSATVPFNDPSYAELGKLLASQDNTVLNAFKEKFAELIVRECAKVFEAEVDTWKEMDPYQGSMKRKGTQAIKQHFGVEE